MNKCFVSVLLGGALLCTPARAETIFEALGEAYTSNPDLQAQRAYLRAMANGYDTNFQIGKGGVSENMTEQIGNALEARELIKLRTLDTCEYGPREAAELLATALSAEVVSVTGSRFVLYRESRKHKKIELPDSVAVKKR